MIINTEIIKTILMDKSIAGTLLEKEAGISRATVSRLRSGDRSVENLTLETIMNVQKWIDEKK